MNISMCLVLCMLFVSVGVNMGNEEIQKDNGHIKKLIKRAPTCAYKICRIRRCCNGYICINVFCKMCAGRDCKSKTDCCKGYTCSYKKCIERNRGGFAVWNDDVE
ncbi:uncharacterized protein LOC143081819 [Mytilus galloprovincialis]|uniref:uncharacterized protein LOC143081819 n=1 Tax=Mytilus galloprovincialis TaxID=29158 RepID=UPI003F7CA181